MIHEIRLNFWGIFMKKLLITGATGFIGRHCLPLLVKHGYEIHALCRTSPQEKNGVSWHQQDLLDPLLSLDFIQEIKPTHFLHLAWEATPGKFWASSENLSWVQASINLVKSFARCGGKRLVVAGTCAEYDWNQGVLSETKTPYSPASLYGASKRGLFLILEQFCRLQNIHLAWGHVFFPFGPGEPKAKFIPQVIQGLLNDKDIPCSHGNQVRDFIPVQEVARAFVELLEHSATGTFNIGSGKGISLKELGYHLASKLGKPELLKFNALSAPPGDPPQLVADIQKISTEINWKPEIQLDEALDLAINSWKTLT
jgi:nucleoside-diphosphate-sugar epimerase